MPEGADASPLDVAIAQLYDELRRLARKQLDRERANHTLDSGALVAEVYARLAKQQDLVWDHRAHLLAMCVRTMRTVLVDHARARGAQKRGGKRVMVTLTTAAGVQTEPLEYLLVLDEALDRLGRVNEEALRVAEARFFGGLTLEETAEALGLTVITVRRRWQYAKVWLKRTLDEEAADEEAA